MDILGATWDGVLRPWGSRKSLTSCFLVGKVVMTSRSDVDWQVD